MPSIERNGASIYYEEHGRGFPILTFAPAGLQSVIDVWNRPAAPVNPITEFAAGSRVIVMDQRNAGGRPPGAPTGHGRGATYHAEPHARPPLLGLHPGPLFRQCVRRVLHPHSPH